jgi:hypothetical protein
MGTRWRGLIAGGIAIGIVAAVISHYAEQGEQRRAPAGDGVTADSAETLIAGVRVSLSQQGQKCRLRSSDVAVTVADLQISWPCAFHRRRDGEVRVLPDRNDSIFLVESSRRDPANPTRCITEVQAVRVQGRTLRPSPHHDVVTICPPFQWDEVMFRALFANP